MPNINGKKFSYTKKGIANAKAYAKKTGATLTMYAMGGLKEAPAGSKGKGLSKLPKSVRNKMGYKKYGGSTSKKK
jgi:hypothetical protein